VFSKNKYLRLRQAKLPGAVDVVDYKHEAPHAKVPSDNLYFRGYLDRCCCNGRCRQRCFEIHNFHTPPHHVMSIHSGLYAYQERTIGMRHGGRVQQAFVQAMLLDVYCCSPRSHPPTEALPAVVPGYPPMSADKRSTSQHLVVSGTEVVRRCSTTEI